MDEFVYCPKCEGTQHEHNLYNPRIHHPLIRAAQFLINTKHWVFIRPLVIPRQDSDETFVPESYRCQTCGHRFLSSNTYAEEIQYSKDLRKKCLFWGLLCLLLSVFMAVALILDCYAGFKSASVIWFNIPAMIPSLTLSCIFLGSIPFSAKEEQELLKEWKQFQDIQAKHTKTVNSNSEEYTPAWKRVQMEQQNQGSV